jgi:hypothetical protein
VLVRLEHRQESQAVRGQGTRKVSCSGITKLKLPKGTGTNARSACLCMFVEPIIHRRMCLCAHTYIYTYMRAYTYMHRAKHSLVLLTGGACVLGHYSSL